MSLKVMFKISGVISLAYDQIFCLYVNTNFTFISPISFVRVCMVCMGCWLSIE
jgi:hypothetical protein